MKIFNKIQQILRFLIEYLSSCDGRMKCPYSETKRLITIAVIEDDVIMYVRDTRNECGCRTCFIWWARMHIEILNVIYEDNGIFN